jgi:sugar (pentulose or hexulose) kinase
MNDYLLGCDIGTTSVKTVLINAQCEIHASKQVGYQILYPRPGWAEQDPRWYWEAVLASIRSVLHETDIPVSAIAGIGLSGMAPNCILVDRHFNPLKSAQVWMDNRATDECDWLREHVGEDQVFRTSANPIHPYYGIPKLMWERKHNFELYDKASKVLSAKDYIVARLTGNTTSDYSTTALGGIAFNIRKKTWNSALLKELGLDESKLPDIAPCEQVIGKVKADAARHTGLLAGTPVVNGTVDTGADAIACNTIQPGTSFLTMGTAICLGVVSNLPDFARGLMAFPHPVDSSTRYITTGVVTSGGALLKWLSEMLVTASNIPEGELFNILDQEAASVPAGSDGLVVLPYFMGERAPIWNANARGVIFGLTLHHGRGHIARALLESVGFALRTIIELAENSGIHYKDQITLIGGGAKSKVWNQILSDITRKPLVEAKNAANAAVGAALLAGLGVNLLTSIQPSLKLGEPTVQNKVHQAIYERSYSLFTELYQALLPQFEFYP